MADETKTSEAGTEQDLGSMNASEQDYSNASERDMNDTNLTPENLGRYIEAQHVSLRRSVRGLRELANWAWVDPDDLRRVATSIQTAHEGIETAHRMIADIETARMRSAR